MSYGSSNALNSDTCGQSLARHRQMSHLEGSSHTLGTHSPLCVFNQGEFTPSHAVGTQYVPMTSLIAGKQLNSIAY